MMIITILPPVFIRSASTDRGFIGECSDDSSFLLDSMIGMEKKE